MNYQKQTKTKKMNTQEMEARLTEIEQAISDLQFARDIAKTTNIHRFNQLNRDIETKIAQHDEILNKIYF